MCHLRAGLYAHRWRGGAGTSGDDKHGISTRGRPGRATASLDGVQLAPGIAAQAWIQAVLATIQTIFTANHASLLSYRASLQNVRIHSYKVLER